MPFLDAIFPHDYKGNFRNEHPHVKDEKIYIRYYHKTLLSWYRLQFGG